MKNRGTYHSLEISRNPYKKSRTPKAEILLKNEKSRNKFVNCKKRGRWHGVIQGCGSGAMCRKRLHNAQCILKLKFIVKM